MNSIQKIKKLSNGIIDYTFYGINDLATGYDVKFIVENYKDLMPIFVAIQEKPEIVTLDDFRLYFLAKKYSQMKGIVALIKTDENKKLVNNLILLCDSYLEKTSTGEVIKYLNSHFRRVFSRHTPECYLVDIASDFLFEYQRGIDEPVWFYLAENFNYLLLREYSRSKKIILSEKIGPTILDKMIRVSDITSLVEINLNVTLDILADIIINHKGKKVAIIAKQKIDRIYDAANVPEKGDISERDLFIRQNIYHKELSFLEKIKDKRANSFSNKVKIIDEKVKTYLETNGKKISYKIPIGEMIKQWNKVEEWEIKILNLTHEFCKEGDVFTAISRLSKCEGSKSIIDFCSTNIPTDEYFTYSLQSSLELQMRIGSGTLLGILHNDADAKEYYKLISSTISCIQTAIKSNKTESLLQDLYMIFDAIETIRGNKNKEHTRFLYYGAVMLICAFSEKILKIVFEDVSQDVQYVRTDNLTLGSILNPDNPDSPLVGLFGDRHLRHLAFFLCTSGENKIGHRLRNSLAHLSDDIEEKLDDQLLAQLLWLFTDILNTVFWHYISKGK